MPSSSPPSSPPKGPKVRWSRKSTGQWRCTSCCPSLPCHTETWIHHPTSPLQTCQLCNSASSGTHRKEGYSLWIGILVQRREERHIHWWEWVFWCCWGLNFWKKCHIMNGKYFALMSFICSLTMSIKPDGHLWWWNNAADPAKSEAWRERACSHSPGWVPCPCQ